ncbi:MAG: hypothetical protein ACIAQF_10080 [Phycisphaerales bacterium JB065]
MSSALRRYEAIRNDPTMTLPRWAWDMIEDLANELRSATAKSVVPRHPLGSPGSGSVLAVMDPSVEDELNRLKTDLTARVAALEKKLVIEEDGRGAAEVMVRQYLEQYGETSATLLVRELSYDHTTDEIEAAISRLIKAGKIECVRPVDPGLPCSYRLVTETEDEDARRIELWADRILDTLRHASSELTLKHLFLQTREDGLEWIPFLVAVNRLEDAGRVTRIGQPADPNSTLRLRYDSPDPVAKPAPTPEDGQDASPTKEATDEADAPPPIILHPSDPTFTDVMWARVCEAVRVHNLAHPTNGKQIVSALGSTMGIRRGWWIIPRDASRSIESIPIARDGKSARSLFIGPIATLAEVYERLDGFNRGLRSSLDALPAPRRGVTPHSHERPGVGNAVGAIDGLHLWPGNRSLLSPVAQPAPLGGGGRSREVYPPGTLPQP